MPPKTSEKTAPVETSKATANRQRDLDAAISSITKAYGDGSIMRLGDARAQVKIEVTPVLRGCVYATSERAVFKFGLKRPTAHRSAFAILRG